MIENKKLSNSSNYLKKSLTEFFNAWFWNEEGKGKFLTTTKIFKIILKNGTEDKRGKKVSILLIRYPIYKSAKNSMPTLLVIPWVNIKK